MATTNENERGFTEWLYNRYVEAVRRNDHIEANTYLDILQRCVQMFSSRKFSRLRRLARELLKEINRAQRCGQLSKLTLRGEEGVREFERAMSDYESQLREMELSEETIAEMLVNRRMDYGSG